MKKIAGDFIEGHVIYVKADDTMTNAWKMMRDYGIRHLVVYGHGHELKGVLSDRDVKLAMTAYLDEEAGERKIKVSLDPELLVSDFMSFPVETVGLEASVATIATRLIEQKISVVVVFDQGRVHGVISYEDLLKEYRDLCALEKAA